MPRVSAVGLSVVPMLVLLNQKFSLLMLPVLNAIGVLPYDRVP